MYDLPDQIPLYTSLLFSGATVFCLLVVFLTIKGSPVLNSKKMAVKVLAGLFGWAVLQLILTRFGVYSSGMTILPPKIILLGVLPILLLIIFIFNNTLSKAFIDNLSITKLTYVHLVRIPVELGLYYLFIHKAIPEVMTFSGENFDILAGITAPIIIYFGLMKKQFSGRVILFWNIICLGLLCYIIALAMLSAPSPFQQLGIEQPNIAIFHYPYSWLPTVIVPIVIFSHLVSIRQLIYKT